MSSTPPEVVAHRGASDEHPEHTLAAYRRALEAGADSLECDVRLTADGHLVLVHDRRLERTSDGRGVLSARTLGELQALDFASWKGAGEVADVDHGRIVTLPLLLGLVRDLDRPVGLAIETKHPTRYAGLVERALVDCLASYGLVGRRERGPVRVMSYSWLSLLRVREWAPRLPTVYLIDRRVPVRWRAGDLPLGCAVVGLDLAIVQAHPGQVGRFHRRGNAVHVYTVNDPADVRLCCDLGVDGLITDRPAAVRALVGPPVACPDSTRPNRPRDLDERRSL